MMRYLLLIAWLAAGAAGPGADWPCWRGPDGTGHVPPGIRVPASLPAALKTVWALKIGNGLAAPVVSGGRVYYSDNQNGRETLHAVAAATGQEMWKADIDEVFVDSQGAPGPRCAPTADGDRVYAQSCRGELQCLNTADGKLLWRTNYVKDFGAMMPLETGSNPGATRHGYSGAPLVDGDRLIAGVGSASGAGIVCFDKRTGQALWKSQNDAAGNCGPIMATLAGVKQVVIFTAEAVLGLDSKNGALLWRAPVKTSLGRHAVTPVVVGDTVVVGSYTAGLIGIRVTRQGDGWQAERAWTLSGLGPNFSSPVNIGPYVYGLGPGRTLFCVEARTGAKTWTQPNFFSEMVNTDHAAFLVMDGKLLTLTDSGQLLLLAADAKEARILGKTTACGSNWCNPAYAGGRLYLRDAKELRCLALLP